MNPWFIPVRRLNRSVPLDPVQPYSAINRYMERYPEPAYSSTPKKEDSPFQKQNVVEPQMKNFARNVAVFVQTAQDVLDQAARLQISSYADPREQQLFNDSVNRLLEQDKSYFQMLDTMEPLQDTAYIQSFEEFVAHWETKAALILAAPPLELIADEDTFHAYAAYSEHKQKTWQLPHQGWLFQTYG